MHSADPVELRPLQFSSGLQVRVISRHNYYICLNTVGDSSLYFNLKTIMEELIQQAEQGTLERQ